jgi:hypothetical protein
MKKEMMMNGASPPKLNQGTLARKQKIPHPRLSSAKAEQATERSQFLKLKAFSIYQTLSLPFI